MQKNFQPDFRGPTHLGEEPSDDRLSLANLAAAARRQLVFAVLAVIAAVACGLIYYITTVPTYSASSSVLIDSANSRLVDQLSAVGGGMEDEASILSQVELLKSEHIALSVVDALGLTTDPRFQTSSWSPISAARDLISSVLNQSQNFVSGDVAGNDEELRVAAARRLVSGLAVGRVGRTYVLKVSYSSPNPELAAAIANGYAEAYLQDQLDSKYEATRRAGEWLQDRIAELRQQSMQSDLAVQAFRAEKGLISASGQLLTDQELSQINTQLISARAETASADARLRSIEAIIQSGEMDAVVSDALDMPVISSMRQRYLDASRMEADISSRLGSNHEAAVRLRTEMQEYRRLMFEELSRIAESYRSTLEIAKARQENLEQQVAAATGVSVSANDSLVQLRELEREAETYRSLYETFLQRYQEAVQQQSFPVTEARVISRADIPTRPSAPSLTLSLALSLGIGLILGGGIGAFREFRDRFYRTGEHARDELGLEFLGYVPLLGNKPIKRSERDRKGTAGTRQIFPNRSLQSHVVDHPTSQFAETIRSIKLAVDLVTRQKTPKIIGIVSTTPDEGKSTISMNLAGHLAKQGVRTLLLDGDLRRGAMSQAWAPDVENGVVEVLLGTVPVSEALYSDPDSGLYFLPTSAKHSVPYSSELLASQAMSNLLQSLSSQFDYIIVDLPPLGPVIDAKAVADKIDAFLMVVEWGGTPRQLVRTTLQSEHAILNKCVGVVLNKVDFGKLKLYSPDTASPYSGNYTYYLRN